MRLSRAAAAPAAPARRCPMLQSCRAAWGARPHAPRATAPSRLQGNAAAAAAASKSPGASRGGSRASAAAAASASAGAGSAPAAVGVVIVDHGSRKRDSNDMLVEFGELYRRQTGARIVEVAHMEIAEPTIEQAIGKCVAAGATSVVVAPYFLSRGRHIQEDIPALVREAQAKYAGRVRCVIADPIGVDPLMAQLISNRVQSALQQQEAVAAAGSGGGNGTAH